MSTATSPVPSLSFRLKYTFYTSKFSPRLGQLNLTRPAANASHASGTPQVDIEIQTPGLMCSTSRGIIQHLSRDNVNRASCVKWVHVPFESFLQIDPPVPTRQQGSYPLHTFLGFSPSQHIVSMSLRDSSDGREMPPNGKLFAVAQSSRGTRKVACPAYRSYVASVLPDVVFAMSDVPLTSPPHSQKRISKSIERSAQWLSSIVAPFKEISTQSARAPRHNTFLHMVGGIRPAARAAFSAMLLEPLESKEKEVLQLETLDEGVSGYVFDLVPLRTSLLVDRLETTSLGSVSDSDLPFAIHCHLTSSLVSLVKASLDNLPATKPRLVNTARSPHEILAFIRDAGVDLFDTFWVQQAATWGVALDFRFPVPYKQARQEETSSGPTRMTVGHNLYDGQYAHDFTRLADSLMDGLQYLKRQRGSSMPFNRGGESSDELSYCPCAACSPTLVNKPLIHSTVDEPGTMSGTGELAPPYTRAYLHHLLHTHEMSAHALLVMHNLTVMDMFMQGVRDVLQRERESYSAERDVALGGDSSSLFATEVARFEQTYDDTLEVLNMAKECCLNVDRSRGKGRLARERAKALEDAGKVPVAVATADVDGIL